MAVLSGFTLPVMHPIIISDDSPEKSLFLRQTAVKNLFSQESHLIYEVSYLTSILFQTGIFVNEAMHRVIPKIGPESS